MSGQIIAILAAFVFSTGSIVTRRSVIKISDATLGIFISVPISLPLFFVTLVATGQVKSIVAFSWQSYLWLSAAGIIHYGLSRSLYYHSVQLVGANVTDVLTRVSPLISVTLGVCALGEQFSWELLGGALLIVFGIVAIGISPSIFQSGPGMFSSLNRKAVVFGVSSGVLWGITAILIKVGLSDSGSPLGGVFISFCAATIAIGMSLWNHSRRVALFSMSKGAIILFCFLGVISSFAHLLRFISLGTAPASVVAPLLSISPVLTVFLSLLLNRKLELFNKAVIIGAIAVVAGTIILV